MRLLRFCKAAFFLAAAVFVGRAGFAILAACPAAGFGGGWAAYSAALAGGGRRRFTAFGVCGVASGGRLFWRADLAAWRRAVFAFWLCVFRRLAIQNAIARLKSQ